MFRDDRCTIKRPIAIEEEGETIGYDEEIIAVDVPCHLSVQSISAVNQTQSTASVLLDYVLYIDTKHKISIKPNDEIIVTTKFNQVYELRADSKNYSMPKLLRYLFNNISHNYQRSLPVLYFLFA